ncbi:hypothetical protein ACLK3K_14660 [Leptospira kirschneri]|nr:hypothetical protein [Leptospira kirschneri]EMJ94263.1 hypothetical protein LEP1GSC198_2111 [Leptospira kirschneri str. JB]
MLSIRWKKIVGLRPKEVYADVLKFQRLGLNLSKGSHKNVLF